MRTDGRGITIETPAGFDVEIFTRPDSEGRTSPDAPAIVHAANFTLPRDRSDFGHEIVAGMRLGDVFVALIEYGPQAASRALFAAGGVPEIDSESITPEVIMGAAAGQAGAQRFFHVGARAFSLYVIVGSYRLRHRTVPLVNEVLRTIRVEAAS
jgi:hypothetical protein